MSSNLMCQGSSCPLPVCKGALTKRIQVTEREATRTVGCENMEQQGCLQYVVGI